MITSDVSITDLLGRWKGGDHAVEEELVERVYPVLRQLAAAHVRRNANVLTLQATELANEAYSKLIALRALDWHDREHFFAIAATVIRRIVIDYLRRRSAGKRGGRLPFVALEDVRDDETPALDDRVDWIGLDDALSELARLDRHSARVVELKFFSALSNEKIAEVCGVSPSSVVRQWRFARAWLGNRMGADASPA